MIVDSSAVVAILLNEPERDAFIRALATRPGLRMSAVTVLECALVVASRLGPEGGRKLDELLAFSGIRIEPFDVRQLAIAREAFRKYGKGRHAAGLNFGDCISYALARATGEPLLYKGADFGQTDIATVPLA